MIGVFRFNKRRRSGCALDALVLVGFFVSGCSALIYQVCWQRELFAVIGVDMDSITIIVSAFMLGIGFGGMIGGWLADCQPKTRIVWYATIELAIAFYGAFSLVLLGGLGSLLSQWGAVR